VWRAQLDREREQAGEKLAERNDNKMACPDCSGRRLEDAASGRQDVCYRCQGFGTVDAPTLDEEVQQAWWRPLLAVIPVWNAYRADEGFAAALIKYVGLDVRPVDLHPWYLDAAAILERERYKLESEYRASEARKQSQRANHTSA
jgi:hypothetical protein